MKKTLMIMKKLYEPLNSNTVLSTSLPFFLFTLLPYLTAFHFYYTCFAYELPLSISINNQDDIEQLIEDELITEEIGQTLLELYENPLELNRASIDELMLLPYISREDASIIVTQREKLKGFKRWIDLALIEEISPNELRQIQNFAYIHSSFNSIDGWGRFSFSDVENDGKSFYSKFYAKTQLKSFLFGLAAKHENDQQYRWKDGIENISPWNLEKFFLAWQSSGFFREIVLGDYSANFGSGLVFNDVHRRTTSGKLYPDYTASTYRQRGVGISMKWNRLYPTLFTSFSKYPVSLSSDLTGLKRKYKIQDVYTERLLGSDLTFQFNQDSAIGFTWYKSWVEKHLDTEFDDFPNREEIYCFGFHFGIQIKKLDFSGEIARTDNKANALFISVSNMTEKIYWRATYRNYNTEFENPHSYGYADADRDSYDNYGDIDEIGSYFLLRYVLHPRIILKLSYDGWRHPSSYSTENEIRGAFECKLTDSFEFGNSTKWNNHELTDYDESKRTNVTWIRILPLQNWRLTNVYRISHHKKEDRSETKTDDYAYIKVEWQTKKNIELEGRWKLYDTILTDGDTYPKQMYIQMQFWRKSNLSGRIRFTHTRYGESSYAVVNPRNRIYFTVRLGW